MNVSFLFKDIRINKAPSKTQSNSNKLKYVLFVVVDIMSMLFLLVATFLIINFSIFCFLHLGVYKPDMFRQIFFPVGF